MRLKISCREVVLMPLLSVVFCRYRITIYICRLIEVNFSIASEVLPVILDWPATCYLGVYSISQLFHYLTVVDYFKLTSLDNRWQQTIQIFTYLVSRYAIKDHL